MTTQGGFKDKEDGGELLLYNASGAPTKDNTIGYVCWGNIGAGSQESRRDMEGKEFFTGDCVDAPGAGKAVVRKPDTDGNDKASYEVANPSLQTCAP